MGSLEAIIADGAAGGETDVNVGSPAFQFVMVVAMEEIRSTDGSSRGGSFDGGEPGMIIDDVVRKKNFLASAAAHVERGKIVEGPRGGDGGEEPVVLLVPKKVW